MAERTFGSMLGSRLDYEPQEVYKPMNTSMQSGGRDFQALLDQEMKDMDVAAQNAGNALGQLQTKQQENATTFLEEPWRGPHDEDY